MARKPKPVLTKTERTQSIIDTFRGLPGEYMMLKGVLCIDHGVNKAIEEKTGDRYAPFSADRDALSGGFDSIMISTRMDELNRGAL